MVLLGPLRQDEIYCEVSSGDGCHKGILRPHTHGYVYEIRVNRGGIPSFATGRILEISFALAMKEFLRLWDALTHPKPKRTSTWANLVKGFKEWVGG